MGDLLLLADKYQLVPILAACQKFLAGSPAADFKLALEYMWQADRLGLPTEHTPPRSRSSASSLVSWQHVRSTGAAGTWQPWHGCSRPPAAGPGGTGTLDI